MASAGRWLALTALTLSPRTALLAQAAADAGTACASTPVSAAAAKPLVAGEYTLTLVATAGSESGARTSGPLRLRPTSPRDRSPRTGRRAARAGLPTPLYGTADLDWRAVGAPMIGFVEPGDTLHPAPTSNDPVYPGVLVFARGGDQVLTIGTLANRRDSSYWLDGAGIGLTVVHSDEHGFSGTWRAWGIVRNGSGYFCAVRR